VVSSHHAVRPKFCAYLSHLPCMLNAQPMSRYSSYSYLTSALDEGEWSASRPGLALPPGKEHPVPIVQEAGWAPEPVWTQRLEEKSSASVGDRTPVVQSVVSYCTDWATAAHSNVWWSIQFVKLIIQFSVSFCSFLSFGSKFSPPCLNVKRPDL
jgi:hypothetical protein